MTRYLITIILAFLCAAAPALAGTTRASDGSRADVQTQLTASSAGDTVTMPTGTFTWSTRYNSAIGVLVPAGVTLQGDGKSLTTIVDQTGASYCAIDAEGASIVLKDFTIQCASSGYAPRLILVSGQDILVKNVKFLDVTSRGLAVDSGDTAGAHSTGVATNCDFYAKSYPGDGDGTFQLVTVSGRDNQAAPSNNTNTGTLYAAPGFGTANMFFIEDSVFWQDAQGDSSVETYTGGKVCVRHCTGTNMWLGVHGNDSGYRTGHLVEWYSNVISVDIGAYFPSAIVSRGGTGVVYNNSYTDAGSGYNFIQLQHYRARGNDNADYTTRFPYPAGQSDGSYRYDGNVAVTHGSGTHTGSANASTLTDAAQSWTTNELLGVGTAATNDTQQTYYIWNRTDGSGGRITAHTATTVTATLSGGTDNDWDNGDTYVITNGYPALDQNGWAGPTRFFGTYSTQTLTPWYQWGNTWNAFTGASAIPFSVDVTNAALNKPDSDYFLQENREFYNNTAMPGYTAYTYPHPLAGAASPTHSNKGLNKSVPRRAIP